MKSKKRAVFYGFLVWVVPFVVAFLIFPLRTSDRAFFESIMPVAVSVAAMFLTVMYFKRVESGFLKEGVFLGFIFLIISLFIDLLMFSKGPMAMSLVDYLKDIGFTYLMIPVITIGIGYALEKRKV